MIGENMNAPVALAVISLVGMGLSAFLNKVAADEGTYFPVFLMIVNVGNSSRLC